MSHIRAGGFSSNLLPQSQSTPNQASLELDANTHQLSSELSHWQALAAMSLGGLTYRLSNTLLLSNSLQFSATASRVINALAPAFNLGAEVAVYEWSHRNLQVLSGDHSNPNALVWSGTGGILEGLKNSYVNFGFLKLGGQIHSPNVFVQHFTQSLSMVVGHEATALLGWVEHEQGSFAQRMFMAESVNLKLGAAMGIAHHFLPALRHVERHLENLNQFNSHTLPSSFHESNQILIPQMNSNHRSHSDIGELLKRAQSADDNSALSAVKELGRILEDPTTSPEHFLEIMCRLDALGVEDIDTSSVAVDHALGIQMQVTSSRDINGPGPQRLFDATETSAERHEFMGVMNGWYGELLRNPSLQESHRERIVGWMNHVWDSVGVEEIDLKQESILELVLDAHKIKTLEPHLVQKIYEGVAGFIERHPGLYLCTRGNREVTDILLGNAGLDFAHQQRIINALIEGVFEAARDSEDSRAGPAIAKGLNEIRDQKIFSREVRNYLTEALTRKRLLPLETHGRRKILDARIEGLFLRMKGDDIVAAWRALHEVEKIVKDVATEPEVFVSIMMNLAELRWREDRVKHQAKLDQIEFDVLVKASHSPSLELLFERLEASAKEGKFLGVRKQWYLKLLENTSLTREHRYRIVEWAKLAWDPEWMKRAFGEQRDNEVLQTINSFLGFSLAASKISILEAELLDKIHSDLIKDFLERQTLFLILGTEGADVFTRMFLTDRRVKPELQQTMISTVIDTATPLMQALGDDSDIAQAAIQTWNRLWQNPDISGPLSQLIYDKLAETGFLRTDFRG